MVDFPRGGKEGWRGGERNIGEDFQPRIHASGFGMRAGDIVSIRVDWHSFAVSKIPMNITGTGDGGTGDESVK